METTFATKACAEVPWEQPGEPRGLQLKSSKQSAEIAKDLLSFEMKDGFLGNKDNKRVDTVKEALEHNDALDKNVLDHKKDDYLKLIESNKLAERESPKQTWNRLWVHSHLK